MSIVSLPTKNREYDYFFQRFNNGRCLENTLPRITTEESEKLFKERQDGLKVLLINPDIRIWSAPNIHPIGLSLISSVVVMDGHKLDILDLNAERKRPIKEHQQQDHEEWVVNRIKEKLNSNKPDVIGIGGIITQYKRIKQIVEICKDLYPDVPIIVGGGIASAIPDFMIKRLGADIISCEEGELTISETLYRLEKNIKLDGCQGIVFKRQTDNGFDYINNGLRTSIEGGENGLDCLPWPLYARWHPDIYNKNPVGHVNRLFKWADGVPDENTPLSCAVVGTRGCPYSCSYCFSCYLGKAYRKRSVKEIVNELQYLNSRYNISYIHFVDDLFLADLKWTNDFCIELEKRNKSDNFSIDWGCTSRTNILANDIKRAKKENRKNILEICKEVGMKIAGFGIETASATILKNIDKSGQTPETIAIATNETKRLFGYIEGSMMIGSRGETRQTVVESTEFCKKNGITTNVVFYTTAYPGTSDFRYALEKGLIGRMVTGQKCPADEDIMEKYFLMLGEQGDIVRTNFSEELSDKEIEELAGWMIKELSADNIVSHTYKDAFTNDVVLKQSTKKILS